MQPQSGEARKFAAVISIALAFFVFLGSVAGVQAQEGGAKYDTPAGILKAVKTQGASNVVQQINKQWLVLHNILNQIATGQKPWLEVAKAMRQGGNPSVILMMQYRMGEALNNNPKNILQFSGKDFDLVDICGIPDTDDMRFDSYESSISELERRRKMVRKVSGKLKPLAKRCLAHLKEAKGYIAQFFGVKK